MGETEVEIVDAREILFDHPDQKAILQSEDVERELMPVTVSQGFSA